MSTQTTLVFAHARRSDPITSHLAAERINGLPVSKLQFEVYSWFLTRQDGATDEELENGYQDGVLRGASTLRSRRKELVELGLLRDSGRVKSNRRGLDAIVWEVVTAKVNTL